MPQQIPADLLAAALTGYQQKLAEIDEQMAALRQRIGGRKPAGPVAAASSPSPSAKPRLSPEGRARIIAAARKRWAAVRKAKEAAGASGPSATASRKSARGGKRAAPGRRKGASAKAPRPSAAKRKSGQPAAPVDAAPFAESPNE